MDNVDIEKNHSGFEHRMIDMKVSSQYKVIKLQECKNVNSYLKYELNNEQNKHKSAENLIYFNIKNDLITEQNKLKEYRNWNSTPYKGNCSGAKQTTDREKKIKVDKRIRYSLSLVSGMWSL